MATRRTKKAGGEATTPARKERAAAAERKKAAPRRRAAGGGPDGASPTPWIFGPEFFTEVLPRVIDACPCGPEHQPACVVHLGDGEDLDLAQVVAVADRYCVLAVFEGTGPDGVARTADDIGLEAIPYELILRVSVRPTHQRTRLGFHRPLEALAAATEAATSAIDGVTPAPRPRPRKKRGARR